MAQLTITEALAEIKTIGKRLDKKQQFLATYLARSRGIVDPLEKDGGSAAAIERELQAIRDLQGRIVTLREAINRANVATSITILDVTHTISEWIVWRREVAPMQAKLFQSLINAIARVRDEARKHGASIIKTLEGEGQQTDVLINVDEGWLASANEKLEEILGTLDGQLSLKNATTMVELPD